MIMNELSLSSTHTYYSMDECSIEERNDCACVSLLYFPCQFHRKSCHSCEIGISLFAAFVLESRVIRVMTATL